MIASTSYILNLAILVLEKLKPVQDVGIGGHFDLSFTAVQHNSGNQNFRNAAYHESPLTFLSQRIFLDDPAYHSLFGVRHF
jgi:hypothetical protein